MTISNDIAIPTFCGFCHTNCGVIASVKNGELRKMKADPNHPGSRGYICPKGAAARQVVYSPERLKHPLRRINGRFHRISWNEALDITATRLLEIKEKYGAEALIRCVGAPMTQAAGE